jgi:hypothetical protein
MTTGAPMSTASPLFKLLLCILLFRQHEVSRRRQRAGARGEGDRATTITIGGLLSGRGIVHGLCHLQLQHPLERGDVKAGECVKTPILTFGCLVFIWAWPGSRASDIQLQHPLERGDITDGEFVTLLSSKCFV